MKKLRSFDIDLVRLSPGTHEFEFKVDSGFFEEFEYGLIEKGELKVKVVLKKHVHLLNITFQIDGEIELTCDRSLEKFDYPLSLTNDLVVKFGEEEDILSEDVIVIRYDEQVLNLAAFIYEFITVAVPLKKLHPKFEDDMEDDEDQLIYSSEEGDLPNEENEEDIDPRWQELLKLKNKNKE